MKPALKLMAVALAVACSGCYWPSEKAVYRVAVEAIRGDASIPKDAVPRPIGEAILAMGQSAARVDLPYEVAGPGGQRVTKWQTVWCKRLERVWVLDRSMPRPVYAVTP